MEVQLQAALVTAGAVVLGLVVQALIAMSTLRQRSRSDDREARWERIAWAVDRTLQDDPASREVGAVALEAILDEPDLDRRDHVVAAQAMSELIAREEDRLALLDEEDDAASGRGAQDGQEAGGA